MKPLLNVIILSCIIVNIVRAGNQHRSVLLSDVQSLTLNRGQKTQARRVSAIPQIRCVGGSARCAFEPDVVQCYNKGSDGVDIQWECTAQMPRKYRFGQLRVSCEGYNHPDDPYILAGSCGLEYHLELTEREHHGTQSSFGIGSFLIKVLIIVGIFFAVSSWLSNRSRTNGQATAGPDHRPPGGGGGGWFSNFFPPGSGGFGSGSGTGDAGRRPPPRPGFRDEYTTYGYDGADCHANNNAGTGGGANFFTGAALGALGGYMFGARNRGTGANYGVNTNNGGWFGGGGAGTGGHTPSPSSSSTYTSTGFGGTTRR